MINPLSFYRRRKEALWEEYNGAIVPCVKNPKRFYLKSIKSDIDASWRLLVIDNLKKRHFRWALDGLKEFLTNVLDYLIVRFTF